MAAPHHIGRSVSVEQALSILEDAAADSADDIRKLISADYRKLKRALTFSVANGVLSDKLSGLKDVSLEALTNAKEKVMDATEHAVRTVDKSAHRNPWPFIGGASAASCVVGYMIGKKFASPSKSKWSEVSG